MAAKIISWHPEYHALLETPHAAQADFSVEQGQTNPFLHLSMHLAIQEQLSIDQPPGIRAAYQSLLSRLDPHEAEHHIMEALGEVVRSEEHTSELQSRGHLVCRLLLEKKKKLIQRICATDA